MNGIQTITDAWGEWLAKRVGASLDFTSSTNYDKCSDYEQYIVTAKPQNDLIRITNSRMLKTATEYQDTKSVENNTNQEQSDEFNFSYEVTNMHKFSVTRALKIGLKISGGISIPFVSDGKAEASTELSISDTNEKTKTEKHTFLSKTTIKIPPHRKIMARANLIINQRISDWELPVLLNGNVAIKFSKWIHLDDSGKPHRLWFIPIEHVFGDVFHFNIIDATGYQIVGSGVHAIAQGECTSSYTSDMHKELREGKINDSWDDMKSTKDSALINMITSDSLLNGSPLLSERYADIIPGN